MGQIFHFQVLTDGLTMQEEQQENAVCAGRGGKEKAKREERFPIELVKKAIDMVGKLLGKRRGCARQEWSWSMVDTGDFLEKKLRKFESQ